MAKFDSSERLPTTSFAIDLALLALSNGAQVPSASLEPAQAPATLLPSSVTATCPDLDPTHDATGLINASCEEYTTQLYVSRISLSVRLKLTCIHFRHTIKRKAPLQDRCRELGLKLPTPTTLDRLRCTLQNYWYGLSILIPNNPCKPFKP